MKVPLKWLADYVPLPQDVAQLVERLTLAGLEVSGVRLLGVPAPEGLRVKSAEAGPIWDRDKIFVLELEVTPNMARCLSMIGVAREVAAITGQQTRLPAHPATTPGEPIDGQVRVVIEDPKLSARYAALLLKNVKVASSPGWMQRRL